MPVPAVAWSKGGRRVTSGGGVAITISDYRWGKPPSTPGLLRDGWMTCSLDFPSVSHGQYGNYTCTATNEHGTVSE